VISLAAVGSASTGKSALLNALFGTRFKVDAAARTTTGLQSDVVAFAGRHIQVIDTPPLHHVTADAYLLVCDKDLTAAEFAELERIARKRRPVTIAINKADTFNPAQLRGLLRTVRNRVRDVVPAERVQPCAADPVRIVLARGPSGELVEHVRHGGSDAAAVARCVAAMLDDSSRTIRVRTREAFGRLGRVST
jgi:GTPase Era involved in 16S rRNA processing